MQIITMFQPEPIISSGGAGRITAVELAPTETRVRLHSEGDSAAWMIPQTAYLSDEQDRHHPLLRLEAEDKDVILVFEALPTATRVFDLVGDEHHRWMGVHSGVRSLHLPSVRPLFHADAEISDSIGRIIRENSFKEELSNDSVYAAMANRLPQLRDYIVWKWKLTAHEAFILRREQERPLPEAAKSAATAVTSTTPHTRTFVNSRMPQPRQTFFQRLFSPRKPRPLSRFEQKMLQENRK